MSSVSVIIPTYNCGRFLAACLESVLQQTLPAAEVIVVDDGSTDDTAEVLARYGDRLTVIESPHAGYAAARNLGLARAHGTWIAFQDADDVALPDRLAFQREWLQAHPDYAALFCNGERMTEAGGHPASPDTVVTPALARTCSGRPLTAADLFAGYPAYFQGALVARTALLATGDFDATLPVYPDMEYAYRLFRDQRAVFVDRVVFRYRLHTANVTRDRLAGRQDIATILERLAASDPDAVARIGRGRLRRRLARHHHRLGRLHLERGDAPAARRAFARAAALRPSSARYQMRRLWHAWVHA
jgi:glycosyltransferase involved in cell wall biosynthesis